MNLPHDNSENKKVSIRFKTLPHLLSDMEERNWIITTFQFKYNQIHYYCLLELYDDNEKRPSDHAKIKLEFFHRENTNNSINAYADFYEVRFKSLAEFCNFFEISTKGNCRDLFLNFAEFFATVLPSEINKTKSKTEKKLIARRLDPDNPNAVYCYDVRRNGHDSMGNNNIRSTKNSQKAEMFCPKLYEKFKSDTNLSFFFSDNPDEEVDLEKMLRRFSERQ